MQNTIAAITILIVILLLLYFGRKGIKAMYQRSREAPQHWGIFAVLMFAVLTFVYLLIIL